MTLNDGTSRQAICRYADLAQVIRRAQPRCGLVRMVAIDGPGGAGKSHFADRLAQHLGGVPIIQTDDFASWENPLGWWARLEDDVLRPLAQAEPVRYRAYDWSRRRLGDWREVTATDVVLLEGVSAARRSIVARLSLAIWIETPATERLARGLERDGAPMRGQWERWMAEEEVHYSLDGARDRADIIVDGAPSLPHDEATEYVSLRQLSRLE